MLIPTIKKFRNIRQYRKQYDSLAQIYELFTDYTMIGKQDYILNLKLAQTIEKLRGAIVECGVWRGGMSAGIAKLLGSDRNYFLFDSFEGLPPAQAIDGQAAKNWQNNKTSPKYYNNCEAEIKFAKNAMNIALGGKIEQANLIKGWFNQTLPEFKLDEPIALLRLDGDWYESTMTCLEYLFPYVCKDGLIIIDDYYVWDGCSRAVHDFLSVNKRVERVSQFENRTAFIRKMNTDELLNYQ